MKLRPIPKAPWLFGAILFLLGVLLLIGGTELVTLGGSPYYLITGAAVALSGGLLWRGRRSGMWLYVAVLTYTLVWSIWEIGFDGWALASRLGAPVVLGAYFLLPHVRRGLS